MGGNIVRIDFLACIIQLEKKKVNLSNVKVKSCHIVEVVYVNLSYNKSNISKFVILKKKVKWKSLLTRRKQEVPLH